PRTLRGRPHARNHRARGRGWTPSRRGHPAPRPDAARSTQLAPRPPANAGRQATVCRAGSPRRQASSGARARRSRIRRSTNQRSTRLAAMPLAVDRYALGPLQTNCYVVRRERGAPECAVVDPGGDAAQLRLELARLDTACAGILITHGHLDPLGGVADLAEGTGAAG